MAQNLWKTQSLTWKREKQDYKHVRLWVGKSLTKKMGLEVTFERVWLFGNIANSCKCCLEANSRQQKQHSEMSVHQQISGWSVEFSSISQMMIGANDLVGKYEGQKTNKVAKYHQNAWRQKWQVWIGFKTPRVAGEAQWARVLCDHFFSWGLARQHSFGYVNSKRLSWSEVIELQKLRRDRNEERQMSLMRSDIKVWSRRTPRYLTEF